LYLQPKVEALLEASREVASSEKLRNVLEMILAMGNYMNKGLRGNAYGFRISSLNKLVDTKSSNNRSMTLMHFLLQLLEKKSPISDSINLSSDLSNVDSAARINLNELEKDASVLRVGLRNVEREIEVLKKISDEDRDPKDHFISVMSDFVTVASLSFAQIDETLTLAKTQYEAVTRSFSEDPSKLQPETFFGIFSDFLQTFENARRENIANRKRKQDEERRRQIEIQRETDLKKRRAVTQARKQSSTSGGGDDTRGHFDDLVSALRSGKVFDSDVTKLQKRSRQRRTAPSSSGLDRERA